MGLSEVQRLLAQLYTSAALREQFASQPQDVALQFGLTTGELEEVMLISQRQLQLFANSLRNKRVGEIAKLLPLTQQVLGARMRVLFQRYADSYIPSGVKKHRQDAVHFAAYLEHVAHSEGLAPLWLADLARYERTSLQASLIERRLTFYTSRYDIVDLARSMRSGLEQPAPAHRRIFILWLRPTPQMMLRVFHLRMM